MSPARRRLLRIAEGMYRTALRAYPSEYRAQFGHQMYLAFCELNAEHADRTAIGPTLSLWAREIGGLVVTAARERATYAVSRTRTVVRQRFHTKGGAPHIPPATAALAVFLVVLAGYLLTLAPTVTFWDAGEFLAASKTLGIPHQPGTPVWVFVSNVWGTLFPIGNYAFRINVMTAVFSAAASALLFSVVLKILSRKAQGPDRLWAYIAAAAAATVSAFTFTMWQNSTESEVYALAVLGIALSVWCILRWRESRGTAKAPRFLILTVYLAALAVGNHLLALLVGPALIGFVYHVIRNEPLVHQKDRHSEWAQLLVLSASWVLLVGTGLGSTTLFTAAALVFVAAAAVGVMRGEARFTLVAVAVSVVGVSTYLFLYIRAGLAPAINMSDPSSWDALLGVIRREQYPVRLPTDNPIYFSGPGNPGRTLELLGLQIINYLQYFDWQWSMGLEKTSPLFAPVRLPFTLAFVSLGVYGASLLRERDRSAFWLLALIFVVMGPGLVGYMNFKPGFSLAYDRFPDFATHEVRERDYFFLVSFQMWGAFAGIGIARLYRTLRTTLATQGRTVALTPKLALPVLAIALLPFVLNFNAATRRHGPDAQLARDFAYDMLQTVEPYGILVTYGDNDTYPLWYLQNVEGIRRDVTVIVRSLSSMDWFMRQLRDRKVHRFDPEQAPWYADIAPSEPPPPLHSLSDEEIDGIRRGIYLRSDYRFTAGTVEQTYPAETVLYPNDILTLRLIQENVGRRSVYFSISAGSDSWVRLGDSLVQEGLAYKLYTDRVPESTQLVDSGFGMPMNLARTDSLAAHVYRYAGLTAADTTELDATSKNITAHFARLFLSLANGHDSVGNHEQFVESLVRAYDFAPNPRLRELLQSAAPGALESLTATEDE